jgi:hypothetical protein
VGQLAYTISAGGVERDEDKYDGERGVKGDFHCGDAEKSRNGNRENAGRRGLRSITPIHLL